MKKHLLIVLPLFALSACHESLEDKTAREATEFTKKECPRLISDGITIDSMTFEKETRTVHYYYVLSGDIDTTAIDKNALYDATLKSIKGDMGLRKYKESGFNFASTYFSKKHKGLKLVDFTLTKKDYSDEGG